MHFFKLWLWEPSAGIPKYCFKSHYSPQCQWKWWIYTSTLVNNYYSPKWRYIHVSTTFTDTEVNNCLGIYHTTWITSGPKSNFICDNIPTKTILFFFGNSEVNSTWLISSKLVNQCAWKVLFTCVVHTKRLYLFLTSLLLLTNATITAPIQEFSE